MFVAVDGDRASFEQAGAGPIRADMAFIPDEARSKAARAEFLILQRVADLFQHQALGIGQHQGVVGIGDLRIEAVHFHAGDAQEAVVRLLALRQHIARHHRCLVYVFRLQTIVVLAATPGCGEVTIGFAAFGHGLPLSARTAPVLLGVGLAFAACVKSHVRSPRN
ncbi:hypothetical protein GALL_494580 [mine drainage metagenome]|uniref:Uncharacterized protein n=1 Tax=mine drainage metagenome TaxID=410659 RepID=A0A1J5PBB1_9ZZZZ